MDKLERLLNLTTELLNASRPLTAEELRERIGGYAERDESFRRQFERDKDDLRDLGVPLVVEEVPGVDPPVQGYRVDRRAYYLTDPGLAPDELAALHLATSMVHLEGLDHRPGLWSLATSPGPHDEDLDTGGTGAVAVLAAPPHLFDLYAAIAARAPVSFGYRQQRREVEPHVLDHQRGRWYLLGRDRDRGERRNFRLDRMEPPVTTGEPGTVTIPTRRRPGARTPSWQMGEGSAATARLLVDASHVAIAEEAALGLARVEPAEAGAAVLELDYTNADGLLAFVFSLLEHVEVLGPPELRAEVVSWLEQVP